MHPRDGAGPAGRRMAEDGEEASPPWAGGQRVGQTDTLVHRDATFAHSFSGQGNVFISVQR